MARRCSARSKASSKVRDRRRVRGLACEVGRGIRDTSGEFGTASESELALCLRECAPKAMAVGLFSLSGALLVFVTDVASVRTLVARGKNVRPFACAPKTPGFFPFSSPPFISGCCWNECFDGKLKRGRRCSLRRGRGCRVASY